MSNDDPAGWLGASDAPPVHDPHRAVRAQTRIALPKRFYAEADLAEDEGGFRLILDGRSANTPARKPLRLPTRALAEAVAAEWAAQVDVIDPSTMPLTRLANTAIDGVAPRREAVIDDLSAYAGTDLVAYRAADPERLVADQARAWDPIIDWAYETYNARLILSEGVMHVTQPETSVTALRGAVEAVEGPFRLAALHTMTTLTGSLLIALATLQGRLTSQDAWAAAHVDESYQASVWGSDAEAEARHALRKAEFVSAAKLAKLAR
ncbi:ATP12 family chaperone protein [Methylobacterium sp. E-045]|uniref:ATP12 family chaperone protein n=1 Tax=Methylobacterium sp. E-045 TaxID=2836575 RepID=UPI001FB95F5C|nr:ATP12 family protein [Methylobacterium sp. E-045]MCJ2131838.1 ATPase [Methylobacterium sp. E-045]